MVSFFRHGNPVVKLLCIAVLNCRVFLCFYLVTIIFRFLKNAWKFDTRFMPKLFLRPLLIDKYRESVTPNNFFITVFRTYFYENHRNHKHFTYCFVDDLCRSNSFGPVKIWYVKYNFQFQSIKTYQTNFSRNRRHFVSNDWLASISSQPSQLCVSLQQTGTKI